MSWDIVRQWLIKLDGVTEPTELTPEVAYRALLELGFVEKHELDDKVLRSLRGYTHKKRKYGLENVVRYGQFWKEFGTLVEEYKVAHIDVLQPTELGNIGVGLRKLWENLVCFAYECMDPELFHKHTWAASLNGAEFERTIKTSENMVRIISPVAEGENGEPVLKEQLPASFDTGWPPVLVRFGDEWRKY